MSQEKSKTMPVQIYWGIKVVYYGIVQVENGRSILFFNLVFTNNGGESRTASIRCLRASGNSREIGIGISIYKPKHIKTLRCSMAYAYVFTLENAEHKCKACSQPLNGLSIPDPLPVKIWWTR